MNQREKKDELEIIKKKKEIKKVNYYKDNNKKSKYIYIY
jgi:hypothetical protein